ncbi:zinc finger MYM-type protein 1-like [Aphis craccivora]|uniref:Zinc finger MYM-type protein 1-like n=1 Tax=Aphis craccivora TaxID=307492 RepID=A0A6G0W3D0_APHCR|nr:zinc finger MYM-type protein 1-like [Aphis craccivora]
MYCFFNFPKRQNVILTAIDEIILNLDVEQWLTLMCENNYNAIIDNLQLYILMKLYYFITYRFTPLCNNQVDDIDCTSTVSTNDPKLSLFLLNASIYIFLLSQQYRLDSSNSMYNTHDIAFFINRSLLDDERNTILSNHNGLEYHKTSILKADHFFNILLKNELTIIDQLDSDRYAIYLYTYCSRQDDSCDLIYYCYTAICQIGGLARYASDHDAGNLLAGFSTRPTVSAYRRH